MNLTNLHIWFPCTRNMLTLYPDNTKSFDGPLRFVLKGSHCSIIKCSRRSPTKLPGVMCRTSNVVNVETDVKLTSNCAWLQVEHGATKEKQVSTQPYSYKIVPHVDKPHLEEQFNEAQNTTTCQVPFGSQALSYLSTLSVGPLFQYPQIPSTRQLAT